MKSRPCLAAAVLGSLGILLGCGPTVVREEGAEGGGGTFHGGGGQPPISSTTGPSSVVSSSSSSSSSAGTGGAPVIPPLVETDFGDVAVGSTVSFDIPPNTLGFTTIVEAAGKYDQIGVQTLVPPAGAATIDQFRIPGTGWDFAWYGITVAGVPQSDAPPAMPVMPGTWQLAVGTLDGTGPKAHVSMWRRQTLDGLFHGGVLDVNVFSAPGVIDQAYVQSMLEEAYGEYAGIALGNVSFQPLPSQLDVIDSQYQMFDALEATSGAPGKPALNVIVVSLITGELEGAAGIAAGIPGLGLEHGTHSSGIMLMLYGDPWIDRIVLRHEAGHLAGLFHTTEVEGGYNDALDDTPVCPDVPNMLDQCPDVDNIMFPYAGFGDAFSPKQERVIHGSSLYRGAVEKGGGVADPLLISGGPEDDDARIDPGARPGTRGGGAPLVRVGSSRRWTARLPDRLARLLEMPRCGHVGPRAWLSMLDAAAAMDPRELVAVGADPTAPAHARRAALALVGRLSPPSDVVDALADLASARDVPRLARAGAIEGLSAAGEADRIGGLDADADRVIATLWARLASR